MSQARFQKRLREKARQEKQAAKRARRAERAEAADEPDADADVVAQPQEVVIAKLAKLHEAFDAEQIDFDTFEEQKQELMAQLRVD